MPAFGLVSIQKKTNFVEISLKIQSVKKWGWAPLIGLHDAERHQREFQTPNLMQFFLQFAACKQKPAPSSGKIVLINLKYNSRQFLLKPDTRLASVAFRPCTKQACYWLAESKQTLILANKR